jgi:competence protein ComEA
MDIKERITTIFKEHGGAAFLGVAGILSIGYGILGMTGASSPDDRIQFESLHEDSMVVASGSASMDKDVVIDVSGAVENPGVYTLRGDSRVQDALIAAGGMSEQADRQQIAQNINLAAPLTDGMKLYIPFVGDDLAASGDSSNTSSGTSTSVLGSQTARVHINTASLSELDALSGVGPVTAQKIIDNRPYQSVDDLVTKKALGQSVFAKIKDQIAL